VNPGQDEYTTVAFNEGEGGDTSGDEFSLDGLTTAFDDNSGSEITTELPSDVTETTAPTADEQVTPEDNHLDDTLTASTDDTQEPWGDTYSEDSITASAETSQETAGDTSEDSFVTATTEGSQTSDDTPYDYSLTASTNIPSDDAAYVGEDDSDVGFTA
jgi:hypothetical protein